MINSKLDIDMSDNLLKKKSISLVYEIRRLTGLFLIFFIFPETENENRLAGTIIVQLNATIVSFHFQFQ